MLNAAVETTASKNGCNITYAEPNRTELKYPENRT
jgi:hypothetical protein